MNCTVTTELMRGLMGADIAKFENQVSLAPRGSGGVITLPFFNGERTPNLPRAKACIIGMDGKNTRPENLLRSAMEGATFALRYGLDRLRELGINASEILLTGGGAGSATWRQVVADVCDKPVTVLQQDEGASFGAALQALGVLEECAPGEIQQLADDHLVRNDRLSCEPGRAAVNLYNETYHNYQESVRIMSGFYS
jgi:xylulokinase